MSESQLSLHVALDKHDIYAGATLRFEFTGDWCNVYDDLPNDEEEARHWFVQEVQKALEHYRNEASYSHAEPGTPDTEDRSE